MIDRRWRVSQSTPIETREKKNRVWVTASVWRAAASSVSPANDERSCSLRAPVRTVAPCAGVTPAGHKKPSFIPRELPGFLREQRAERDEFVALYRRAFAARRASGEDSASLEGGSHDMGLLRRNHRERVCSAGRAFIQADSLTLS